MLCPMCNGKGYLVTLEDELKEISDRLIEDARINLRKHLNLALEDKQEKVNGNTEDQIQK